MKVMVRSDNKVVLSELPERREFVFDPDEAVHFAMSVAEAAARCGFTSAKQSVLGHVEQEMQARVTAELRAVMINRVALVLPQLIEKQITPAHAAATIVDIVLNQAQGRVVQ